MQSFFTYSSAMRTCTGYFSANAKRRYHIALVCMETLIFLPQLALAHDGHHELTSTFGQAFIAGLMHPISGSDHMVMALGMGMVAFGLRHSKAGLAALTIGLMGGFGLISSGVLSIAQTAWIEHGIVVSVLLVMLALASKRLAFSSHTIWRYVAVAMFGVLAMFHGMAHGLEVPAGASSAGFLVGMTTTMATLFGMGMLLIQGVNRLATHSELVKKILAVAGVAWVVLG